ncbi:acetate/propionate family kinase [Synechococcus elongatus]|uniref:Acetate kinase n=1 Tax=Synechococcus elongatus PCC 11802 TaxID=2283154 RepID=A0AAT9JX05_SYNEL|nr:acetate/propionate family kinase [Synechococcus elongatus]QFZ91959.1 acetate/propionate family kinase [Synechococcus elongatus PCC 11802]
MQLLTFNAGSSSYKLSGFEITTAAEPIDPFWQVQIDWQVDQTATLTQSDGSVQVLGSSDRTAWLETALETLPDRSAIAAVVHRVVHGGQQLQAPILVTSAVKAAIAQAADLAPLHNPLNLAGIELMEQVFGSAMPQIAVFDTAFHQQMPVAAAIYGGPYAWWEQGYRRYGFHGISHQYLAERCAQLSDRPLLDLQLVTAHLGNGCSLAAIRNGHSVDTSMGFSPLEGLVMGSRSGSVDPGLLLQLLQQPDCSPHQLSTVLNQQSGLLGLSGRSNDVRELAIAAEAGDQRSQLALAAFTHSLRRHLGAMLASLERLDALVFAGGIGENYRALWPVVCEHFAGLRIRLDPHAMAATGDRRISSPDSAIAVWVIHSREDWQMVQLALPLLRSPQSFT